MARIFALSDIHVDQIENLQWVEKLSFKKYQDDVLILAGDVTDKIPLLKSTLLLLTKKFQRVFFVPGNHDLWIREANSLEDSCIKFERILAICKQLRVETSPALVDTCDGKRVWIVPMFSWYSTPEEDKEDSLYIIDPWVPNDRQSTNLWMDNRYCVWPDDLYPETPAQYFSSLNEERCSGLYDEPVISFSHFVPRKEMIKATPEEDEDIAAARAKLGFKTTRLCRQGASKGFNFTRYAGSKTIDRQLRQMGSSIHVFGHQHRNRDRMHDGVRYVSFCLGGKHERQSGLVTELDVWEGPKQIYPQVHRDKNSSIIA